MFADSSLFLVQFYAKKRHLDPAYATWSELKALYKTHSYSYEILTCYVNATVFMMQAYNKYGHRFNFARMILEYLKVTMTEPKNDEATSKSANQVYIVTWDDCSGPELVRKRRYWEGLKALSDKFNIDEDVTIWFDELFKYNDEFRDGD